MQLLCITIFRTMYNLQVFRGIQVRSTLYLWIGARARTHTHTHTRTHTSLHTNF